jgi:hypothetical protein
MKKQRAFWVIFLLTIASITRTNAQFYAPETEFHDKAQRLFAVEAARVIAWRENLGTPKVVEVAFTVKTGTDRTTTWDLSWLDKSGRALKKFQVKYPESLLEGGPEFYREVFRQIWSASQTPALTNISTVELNSSFWHGAELTGIAREEGLKAAFDLARTNLDEARSLPSLAGLLTHIPMPSLCGGVTLDGLLLARGAAWLALSEKMLTDPRSASNENWAPLLFMSGRENAACELWKSRVAAGQDNSRGPVLFEWWDFFLRQPNARAAFEFAASSRQRRFGMPMMTYYSRVHHLGAQLADILVPLYGPSPDSLRRLYNYGSFFSAATSIGGGRLLEGAWPAIFRKEWMNILNEFTLSPQDYVGHRDKLKAASPSSSASVEEADDLSLTGLKESAPLLELAQEQGGKGALIPVATVTARDLLNYGWEMNGLQMGARFYFVNERWGVRDLAQKIFDQATRDIQGQAPFFPGPYQKQIFNLKESMYRLQMVDDLTWRIKVDVQPFSKDITDTNAARIFYQRCWLRPYEVRFQAYTLCRSGQCDEATRVLKRYHRECGRKSDQISMEYIADWNSKELAKEPALQTLGEQLAEAAPEPTETQIKLLFQKKYQQMSNAERAQAYEKLFWQNPDSNLEQSILNGYIVGGAWKSAKRFYTQAREVVTREVGFSNFMAPKAWMLGFLDGDENLMTLALEDSNSGSSLAMLTTVWHYAVHDQTRKMQDQLDELIERYESDGRQNSQGRKMKSFIPLMPALKDPKHPRHEEALDHFGKSEAATNLRWILIQKYHLSVPDAIRFLGGRETDRYRRVLILYLEKQKEPMRAALTDYLENTKNTGVGRVVSSWAEVHLLNLPCGIEEKDLRPPGVKSIEQAVLDKIGATR